MTLRNTLVLTFGLIAMLVIYPTIGSEDKPVLSIVYTSPHPVINEIIFGFKEAVVSYYPEAKFFERHANGIPDEYGSAVLAAIVDRPQILAPITTPITKLAVERARGKIPIVFMGVTDPVGAGVVATIEKPVMSTGSSDLCPFSSLLDLTRRILPDAKVLGLPYNPKDQPAVFGRRQLMSIASDYGFTIVDRQVTSADELSTIVKALAQKVDGVIIAADNLMMENPSAVASAARDEGKPTFACDKTSIEAGAVAGVGVDYRDVGRLAGERAVRILNGETAGTIPVAVLKSGYGVVNKRVACAFDLPISKSTSDPDLQILYASEECAAKQTEITWTYMYWLVSVIVISLIVLFFLRRQRAQSS